MCNSSTNKNGDLKKNVLLTLNVCVNGFNVGENMRTTEALASHSE